MLEFLTGSDWLLCLKTGARQCGTPRKLGACYCLLGKSGLLLGSFDLLRPREDQVRQEREHSSWPKGAPNCHPRTCALHESIDIGMVIGLGTKHTSFLLLGVVSL